MNTNTNNTNNTAAVATRSTRIGVVAGALVAGISLLGLTACQLELPTTPVRSSSATEIEQETSTTETPDTSSTVPASSVPPISLPLPLPTPETTVPATVPVTVPAPTIPAPLPAPLPIEATVEVPAGALDLGDGVFVPVSVGWTGTLSDGVVELTDGTVDVALMVLRREPGENPQTIIDEYVASAIDPVGTVSSGPVTMRWSTEAPRPAMEYGFFYTSFDPAAADGKGIAGGVSVYIRNDGLTLIYDVWAPASVSGALADDSFNAMIDSFLAAPEAATPAALTMVPDFRVTTTSAVALVGPLAGFTVAPGFVVEASTPDYALATSASSELAVLRSAGRTDQNDSLVGGIEVALTLFSEPQFADDQTFEAPDALGVARSSITFTTGARSGSVVVYFDTTTGNAFNIITVWDGAPGAAAEAAALSFMQHSMANSFANIV